MPGLPSRLICLACVTASLWAQATTTSLNSNPNPSTFGAAVTLTATVTPGSAIGKVTFYAGTTVLGTATLSGGVATFATKLLPAGALSLRAYYLGGGGNNPSTSSPVAHTVNAMAGAGFRTAVNYGAGGGGPYNVAVGDFNEDGKADVAVANFFPSMDNIGVLLGNGDGTFQTVVPYVGPAPPASVAVGDFNGDGHADLVAAIPSQDQASVRLGNGNGTFQTGVSYSVGDYPSSVTVGDFNGDGRADLAVANQDSANVSVLAGNGDGTFAAATSFSAGTFPSSVVVGDFNGDGKADLAVTNSGSNNVSVLLGNGAGSFAAAVSYSVGSSPSSVVVGDFNNDGRPDLAVANTISNTVSLLLGNSDGTFQPASALSAGNAPVSVVVGDFNGDGNRDLALANIAGHDASVLLGNGNGTFQSPTDFAAGTGSRGVVVGDFNGDGRADLAVANNASDDVSILLATFPSSVVAVAGTPQSATVGTIFSPMKVKVTDAANNPISGVSVTFTAPASGASGAFPIQGVFQTDTNGLAEAWMPFTANNIAGSYTVTASVAGVATPASFSLTNLPGAANRLAFIQQPSSVTAGSVITPPVTVQLRDSSGNNISTAGIPVTLTISSGSGTLAGTATQSTNASGLAVFSNVSIDLPGAKTLTATSAGLTSAVSASFTISQGAGPTITAVAGTPQSAIVGSIFFRPLEVRVADAANNPLSGINVTFTAPSSGASGSFGSYGGSVNVSTGVVGIATVPIFVANSIEGSYTVTATAAGAATPAVFSLTNMPVPSVSLTASPSRLSFEAEVGQNPSNSASLSLGSSGEPLSFVLWQAPAWLRVSPAGGITPATLNVIVDSQGLAAGTYTQDLLVSTVVSGSVLKFLNVPVKLEVRASSRLEADPPALSPTAVAGGSASESPIDFKLLGQAVRDLFTALTEMHDSPELNWLRVFITSGTGNSVNAQIVNSLNDRGSVRVRANPAGLPAGVYKGAVVVKSPLDNANAVLRVPVTFYVPAKAGDPQIGSIVNAASFRPGAAPNSLLTIFGINLAAAEARAETFPLPTTLGGVSVTVNGQAAPLLYVGPGQINFQLPPDIAAPADVTVQAARGGANTNTLTLRVEPGAPGVFVTQNADFTLNSPSNPCPPGGTVLVYGTGLGRVTRPVAAGQITPSSPLSYAVLPVTATVGGQPATVLFAGLTPGFAGLAQTNVQIPAGLTPGNYPVVIIAGGVSSNAGTISVGR